MEMKTLHDLLINAAGKYENNVALSNYKDNSITYSETAEYVTKLQFMLDQDGYKKSDKLALLSENCLEWCLVYLAVTGMDMVIVPILPDFHDEEIKTIMEHSESTALFYSSKYTSTAEKLKSETFKIYSLKDTVSALKDKDLPGNSFSPDRPAENDIASLIYTSGTTGQPKGVLLSHKNLISDIPEPAEMPHFGENDASLSILPLSHTYECTIGFLIHFHKGCTITYLGKAPTATLLLNVLKEIRPHSMLSVPLLIEKIYRKNILAKIQRSKVLNSLYGVTAIRKLLNIYLGKKLYKLFGGRLRFFGLGGAGLAPDVEQFLREAKFPYSIGYGLTETSPLLSGSSVEETKYTSAGRLLKTVEVRLEDKNPETGIGELWVKGPNIMQGYYKNPELTAEVLTEDGWFNTGDLGYLDKDNFVFLRGRSKNVIVGPSGENIYPESIESIINEFQFVEESLVVKGENGLEALIHFDMDGLKKHLGSMAEGAKNAPVEVGDFIKKLTKDINKRVNAFSRISNISIQDQPFIKTPTKKIKRFLYSVTHKKDKKD